MTKFSQYGAKYKMLKYKKAWLIEWVSTNNQQFPTGQKFIGLYDGRTDYKLISKIIEFYYATHYYNKSEMAKSFCGNNKCVIYPVLCGDYVGKLSCGNNPYISARLVSNVVIKNDELLYDEIKN